MKNYIKYFLLVVIIASCNKNPIQEGVEIPIDLNNVEEGKFSDIFNSIEYVLLKDTDSLPLVQPYKIVYGDSLIFVEDQEFDNLFIFRKDGTLKSVLEAKGGGPKEFNQLQDYQVFNNTITIMDVVSGKLIDFDLEGRFISERRLKVASENFVSDSNFELYFFNNNPYDSSYNFLRSENELLEYNVSIEDNYEGVTLTHLNGFMYSSNLNRYYIDIPYSYSVAEFSNKGNFEKIIEFDFLNYSLTSEERLNMRDDGSLYKLPQSQIGMLDSFYPIGQNYSVCWSNSKDSYISIFNSNFENRYIGKNLKNDIDGLDIFKMLPWTFSDDGVIFKYPAYRILSIIEKSDLLKSSNSNLTTFFNENRESLKEDLTVLVKLKLKSNFL